MEKKKGNVHYGASGTQTGGRVNFVGVGSSTKGNLGDEYYSQSYYDLTTYKKCIDKGIFPTFRGMKLSKDDKIRQKYDIISSPVKHLNFENSFL